MVKDYYNALNQFGQLNISHEMAVRQAFASLLDSSAKPFGWKLVPEFRIAVAKKKSVIVDGALLDTFTLRRGYWEAKDLGDDLERKSRRSSSWATRATTLFSRAQHGRFSFKMAFGKV